MFIIIKFYYTFKCWRVNEVQMIRMVRLTDFTRLDRNRNDHIKKF